MANSTWEQRDLPVLRAIVEMSDNGAWVMDPEEIATHAGMDVKAVRVALCALADEQPAFFSFHDVTAMGGPRELVGIHNPTGHARRTVGTWPTPDSRVDQLVEALMLAADREPDQEKSGALRTTAKYIAGVGRDLFIGIVSGAITGG